MVRDKRSNTGIPDVSGLCASQGLSFAVRSNMFGKFTANLKRKGRGSHGSKFRLEVQVVQVKGLPSAVKKCRLVWSRSAKVQMTDVKDVKLSGKPLLCKAYM